MIITTEISPSVSSAAEIDDDDVDDIGAMGDRHVGIGVEEVGQLRCRTAVRTAISSSSVKPSAAGERDGAVAQPVRRAAGDRRPSSRSRVMTSARMTTDRVSTMNWVKDRSGAPNSRKMHAPPQSPGCRARRWRSAAVRAAARRPAPITAISINRRFVQRRSSAAMPARPGNSPKQHQRHEQADGEHRKCAGQIDFEPPVLQHRA